MNVDKRKKSTVILAETFCQDLNFTPGYSADCPTTLSQHMISTFEDFRNRMDLSSNNSSSGVSPRDEGKENNQTNKEEWNSSVPDKTNAAKSQDIDQKAEGPSKEGPDNVLTESLKKPEKARKGNSALNLNQNKKNSEVKSTESASISNLSAKHFIPTSGKIRAIWKHAKELIRDGADDNNNKNSKEADKDDPGGIEEAEPALDEEEKSGGEETEEDQAGDYNPYETPRKRGIRPAFAREVDEFYKDPSSDESDVEVLIKVPKLALVRPMLQELTETCPSCRVLAVDIPGKTSNSVEVCKDYETLKEALNLQGSTQVMFHSSMRQDYVVAHLEDGKMGKAGKGRPSSANFSSLHSKFDPTTKNARPRTSIAANLSMGPDIRLELPGTNDNRLQDSEGNTCDPISEVGLSTNHPRILRTHSNLLRIPLPNSSQNPLTSGQPQNEGPRPNRTVQLEYSLIQPGSSKPSDSELEVIEVEESCSSNSPRPPLSRVDSWRNFSLSSEYSYHKLNTQLCEVVLDTPPEKIFQEWERERQVRTMLDSPLFSSNHTNNHKPGEKSSKKSGKNKKRGQRQRAGAHARACAESVNDVYQFQPEVDKDSDEKFDKRSQSSSSCFSAPDEPEDPYDFAANIREGEFPFISEDSASVENKTEYMSGSDPLCSKSDTHTKSRRDVRAKSTDTQKTPICVKSSSASVYSVGASLIYAISRPPKPSAIRAARSGSMAPLKGRNSLQGKDEKLLRKVSSSTVYAKSLPCSRSSCTVQADLNSNWTSKPRLLDSSSEKSNRAFIDQMKDENDTELLIIPPKRDGYIKHYKARIVRTFRQSYTYTESRKLYYYVRSHWCQKNSQPVVVKASGLSRE